MEACESERLLLLPLADVPPTSVPLLCQHIKELFCDPDVMRYFGCERHWERDQDRLAEALRQDWLRREAAGTATRAIILTPPPDGRFLGIVGATFYGDIVSPFVVLRRGSWGLAIASEAVLRFMRALGKKALVRPGTRVSATAHPENTASLALIERLLPGCASEDIRVHFAKSGLRKRYTEAAPGVLRDVWTKKRLELAEHLPRSAPAKVARKLVELRAPPIGDVPPGSYCPAALLAPAALAVAFAAISTNTSTELHYTCAHPTAAARVVLSLQDASGAHVPLRVRDSVPYRVFEVTDRTPGRVALHLRAANCARGVSVCACIVEVADAGRVLAHSHTTPFAIHKYAPGSGPKPGAAKSLSSTARQGKASGIKFSYHYMQPPETAPRIATLACAQPTAPGAGEADSDSSLTEEP